MASLNKVFLIGGLTRDPELRYAGDKAVVTLGLAVNEKYGSGDNRKESTLFVDVDVWGKSAENCCEYLSKGSPVCIEGRLRLNEWEGKDGTKKKKILVVANSVQFLPNAKRRNTEFDEEAPPISDDDVPF